MASGHTSYELNGQEAALVADAVDLDVEDRAGDQFRDTDVEELLNDAVERLRAGKPLLAEQVAPVADVIELNLEERCGDVHRDAEAEKALTRALKALRGDLDGPERTPAVADEG